MISKKQLKIKNSVRPQKKALKISNTQMNLLIAKNAKNLRKN